MHTMHTHGEEKQLTQSLVVQLDEWGADSFRVLITPNAQVEDPPIQALLLSSSYASSASHRFVVVPTRQQSTTNTTNGNLIASLDSSTGLLTFVRKSDGRVLLRTLSQHFSSQWNEKQQKEKNTFSSSSSSSLLGATVSFAANEKEQVYGLGEHRTGRLQNKPIFISFQQSQLYTLSRGADISIPFYQSSLGYGFLWNLPSFGYVNISEEHTTWYSNSTFQIDYWITTTPDSVAPSSPPYPYLLQRYVHATGHPPSFPSFASGFWQSKNRYRNQTELLSIGAGYLKLNLPVSVLVIDYYHWKNYGDWSFDHSCWPDPSYMTKTLHDLYNIDQVMVSVWPVVSNQSHNFEVMKERGFLVKNAKGEAWPCYAGSNYVYDPFHPDARAFVFQQLKSGYYDHGIKVYWLDADEPERKLPDQSGEYYYHMGRDLQIGMAFPRVHQQMVHDGLTSLHETDIIMLSRSAWAGTQRLAAAVWSGDIPSTFEELNIQVRVAQNMAMSGIYWWTTDIGGYVNGNINDPLFRELVVRWFQFGAFCPLFRLHGKRSPIQNVTSCGPTGAPNEIWHFGEPALSIISDLIHLREKLRPYIMKQMSIASLNGTPLLRPMIYACVEVECQQAEDQFMFGPDWLVAPVMQPYASSKARSVYLPSSENWVHYFTGKTYTGGQTVTMYDQPSFFTLPCLSFPDPLVCQ
ncbi:Alpha-xylosidase [Balamuthia mandrillaris]